MRWRCWGAGGGRADGEKQWGGRNKSVRENLKTPDMNLSADESWRGTLSLGLTTSQLRNIIHLNIFILAYVLICDRLQNICMFTAVNRLRLNQVIGPLISSTANVCLCLSVFSVWKVSTVLMQLILTQKEGRGKGGEKKGKKDTPARFWWLSWGETLSNKWWVVEEGGVGVGGVKCCSMCVFLCVFVWVCALSIQDPVRLLLVSGQG